MYMVIYGQFKIAGHNQVPLAPKCVKWIVSFTSICGDNYVTWCVLHVIDRQNKFCHFRAVAVHVQSLVCNIWFRTSGPADTCQPGYCFQLKPDATGLHHYVWLCSCTNSCLNTCWSSVFSFIAWKFD
jgi:hypothetical protein